MNRKLRAFGLALVAICAASAIAVSAAQAGIFETAGTVEATITGEQTEGEITGQKFAQNEIITAAGLFKCKNIKFHGKFNGFSTEIAVTPTFEECTLGGEKAEVKTNDCKYEFKARETVDPKSTDVIYSELTIGCKKTPEKPFHKIMITIPGTECEVGIVGTGLKNEFIAENTTTAQPAADIDFKIDAEEMVYTVDNGEDCPNEPADDIYLDGTYEGMVTLRAEGTEGVGPIELRVK